MNPFIYDLAIIGTGPAGISAMIHALKSSLRVVVFEAESIGGRLNEKSNDEYTNLRKELFSKLPENFNSILKKQFVNHLSKNSEIFSLKTKEGEGFLAKSVIIATGARKRKLELSNSEKFTNLGIFYSMKNSEQLSQDKKVVIVGGGYSGCESAIYLSKFARKIYLIHHGKELKTNLQSANSIINNKKIEIFFNSEITEINGNDWVRSITILVDKKQKMNLEVDVIFPHIGLTANSALVNNFQIYDQDNHIKVDENYSTMIPGLFAIGDVSMKKNQQIITAISNGIIAVSSIIKYLS